MNYKKILLFAASIFIIIIFFSSEIFPNNSAWLDNKVLSCFGLSETSDSQWDLLDFQFKHLDIEERRRARLGNTYIFCRQMADYFKKEGVKDPLVLLPSQDYVKYMHCDFLMPEPIVFYLESGYKGAWVTSKNVDSTNYAVIIEKGEPAPVKIGSNEERQQIIKEFSKKLQ
jgi:hypothetical protein